LEPLTHIAIRISDKTYGLPSTVLRHNLVSCRNDSVWFGKPDWGLPLSLVERLNGQIRAGLETRLITIDPDHSNPVAYVADLQAVSLEFPPEKELIPRFYTDMKLLPRIKAWLKVDEFQGFRIDENEGLLLANAIYEIQEKDALLAGSRLRFPGYFELEPVPPEDGP
jgi:hypothetical protein